MVGGKACGMLLARAISRNHAPEIYQHLEPHDSYYIGSDVFYSYIVDNQFWDLKIRQREKEGYFSLAGAISHLCGKIRIRLLRQYRQHGGAPGRPKKRSS